MKDWRSLLRPESFLEVVRSHSTMAENVLLMCRRAARLLACLGGHVGERKHNSRGLKRPRNQMQR
uniref:Expressed protein n=1 Tax=Echinococcus granulosus TaxID=6210 RepID=A0A068WQ75_ECHGR|nr:expressed protein [Echinococcus granulosus]